MIDLSLKKAQELLKIALILQGNKQILSSEKTKLKESVEKSKKWIAKQPDYLKFFQQLQVLLHQNNIGAFSELLSYFVKDVLKKDKNIILDLSTYHNLPSLKIEASNDGCRESIMDGSGGSIANIVSTGLRLIALSRLSHRKFIVLDEPDCWLKPEHVPTFAKIIGEIAEKLQIQTVLISHHNWEYFKDYGKVIELKSDGKNLFAETIHSQERDIPTNLDYIKNIELKNLMSHHHTNYELDPYLTCLIGENDLGKSVLGVAVKAVAYNDSSDSYIKHHTNEAQVLITTSLNTKIFWQRFKETTQENPQKVKYTLYENNQQPISEFESNSTPKFIEKALNIITTEDIDIHIGNQKQPVFLLSSDVKPQQRAKILSLGKESLYIQKMMENIKNKTKLHKQTIKEGEIKYDIITKQLEQLNNTEDIIETLNSTILCFESIKNKQEELAQLKETILELKDIQVISKISKINTSSENLTITDLEQLKSQTNELKALQLISKIKPITIDFKQPELLNTNEITNDLKKIKITRKASSIPLLKIENINPKIQDINLMKNEISDYKHNKKLSSLPLIETIDTDNIKLSSNNLDTHLILELKTIRTDLKDLESKKNHLDKWEETIKNEFKDYIKDFGNICPTCNQSITSSHLHIKE